MSDFRMSANLYLFGEDLDPAAITELVAVQPTRIQKRGDMKTHPITAKTSHKKFGLWSLGHKMDGPSVSEVIDKAIQALEPIPENALTLPGVTSAKFDIFAVAEVADGRSTCSFRLTAEQVARLTQLNVGIEITVETIPQSGER